MHKCERPRKLLDNLKLYKLYFCEIVIRLVFLKVKGIGWILWLSKISKKMGRS